MIAEPAVFLSGNQVQCAGFYNPNGRAGEVRCQSAATLTRAQRTSNLEPSFRFDAFLCPLVQACSPCPPGADCLGSISRPVPRQGTYCCWPLAPSNTGRNRLWAGYTFGNLSSPGNGTSEAVLPIVKCHSDRACRGGETHAQCFPGYADTRCADGHERTRLAASPAGCAHCSWGFARRCGTCDVGYYSLWGQCRECGPDALVVFLSRAVPALGALALTSFFFYGGELALPRRSAAIACGGAYPCYKWYVDGLERRVCRAAESNSRLLVMVPFMDTVICVIVPRFVECRSNVAPLSGGLARSRYQTRSRLQLQVLATLGSLSGISYPSHVQEAISVAKLANLDLVRSAEHLHARPVNGSGWS
jgi:hypothetical protein